MSDFDRENKDVFDIVHNNPNRTGMARTVGYIVPLEQMEELEARKRSTWDNIGWMIIAALAVVVATVAALA